MFPVKIILKNGKEIEIDRAHVRDAKDYCEISNRGYKETRFLSRSMEDEEISLESCISFIEDVEASEKEALVVARYEGRVIGYGDILACLNRRKMRHKCNLNVFVAKDSWGLGIGSALMDTLIKFAYNAGYEKIDLSVAHDNDRAIRLYERFGFEITGREVHAMKHADGQYSDWVFMVKFLR
ncbi:MAG: GNAT family N-acetyltransferase [Lachnospiraceae bacterium]|nr:GNAT family N-acetyltransferase [Lachnospiraceae bacterium]